MQGTLSEKLRRYTGLSRARAGLDLEAKRIYRLMLELEDEVLEEMADESIDGIKVDGVGFFLRKEVMVKKINEDREDYYEVLAVALERAGMASVIRPNMTALKPRVAELDELPSDLAELIEVTQTHRLGKRGING